jgi:hypothetical protein
VLPQDLQDVLLAWGQAHGCGVLFVFSKSLLASRINSERVTLKRFYVEADGIRLQPANPAMEPIYLRHEELHILGIVSGVIRT